MNNIFETLMQAIAPAPIETTAKSEKLRAKAQAILDQAAEDEELARRKTFEPQVIAARDAEVRMLRERLAAVTADNVQRDDYTRTIDNVSRAVRLASDTLDSDRLAVRRAIVEGAEPTDVVALQSTVSLGNSNVLALVAQRSELERLRDAVPEHDENADTLSTTIANLERATPEALVDTWLEEVDRIEAANAAEQQRFMSNRLAREGLPPTQEELAQRAREFEAELVRAVNSHPYIAPPVKDWSA